MADLIRLVKQAQAGDKEAFIDLSEYCKQALYKTATAMLKNDADAADSQSGRCEIGRGLRENLPWRGGDERRCTAG